MKMLARAVSGIVAALTFASCTVHQTERPPLTGPSELSTPPASQPTATFQFSPTTVVANQAVLFDGTTSCGGTVVAGTCQNTSQIVRYDWNFGDGTSGTGPTITHRFPNAADFSVMLTTINDGGLAASTSRTVTVTVSDPPTATVSVSPSDIKIGDLVFFSGLQSTAAANRTIVRYDWDFGDGTGSSGATARHAYSAANTFTATLTVTDDIGQKKSATAAVTVAAPAP